MQQPLWTPGQSLPSVPSRRSFLAGAGAIGMAGFLAACSGSSSGNKSSASKGSGGSSASAGGGGISPADTFTKIVPVSQRKLAANQDVVMRGYAEPVGFDPATLFQIATEVIAIQIYEGLTSFDPMTGKALPGLAESWDISSDGLTYTFHLRKGVQWHFNYGEFTAKDVIYSYNRVLDPKTASPYRLDMSNIASMTAPDPYTVVIRLHHPEANFLLVVTNNHNGQIVNQAAVEKFGTAYSRNPVGTGPFYLDSWVAQSRIILKKFPDYHLGPASLNQITWELIIDGAAASTAIAKGEVDVGFGLNSLTTEQFQRVQGTNGISIATSWANLGSNWLFGGDFAPFKDVRVRRAFVEAIDNVTVSQKIAPTGNLGGTSIVPPWMAEYDKSIEPIGYDVADAKKLLQAAGYGKGFTVAQITGAAPSQTQILQQNYLSQVGIDMTFDVSEPPVYNSKRQNGNIQLSYRGYPAINIDTLLSGYLDSRYAAPNGFNTSKVNDPKLDAMLATARQESNNDKRIDDYHEIQKYANQNVLYPAFGFGSMSISHKNEIKNIQPNRLCTFSMYDVYRSA
ncbi:MAG: transporter substrate-binding protein [Pseudonocardiales bacterium]|nr:transporter substrate-binding protein [Pseudonocardiales bacterium]